MHLKTTFILGFVLVFGFAGCATPRSDEAWPTPRPLGSDLPTFRPPVEPEETPSEPLPIEEPSGAITLRQALALALMKNPELAAFSWEVRAQEAAMLQAGLFPNPTIGADLQDIGATDASAESVPQPQSTLQLSQLIELGGKRSKRRGVASFTRDLAGWDYETKRIDVATQVSQAFIGLLSSQQQLALTEETALSHRRSMSG